MSGCEPWNITFIIDISYLKMILKKNETSRMKHIMSFRMSKSTFLLQYELVSPWESHFLSNAYKFKVWCASGKIAVPIQFEAFSKIQILPPLGGAASI